MKIPFPQANNLELIFNTLCIFPLQGTSISETDLLVDYLPRQKAYYFNALLFLGFLKKEAHQYVLSDCGLAIRKMENKTLQIARFIDVVLSDSEMADLYHNSGKIREVEQKMTFYAMYLEKKYKLSPVTARRRASTVNSWFKWIDSKITY